MSTSHLKPCKYIVFTLTTQEKHGKIECDAVKNEKPR